MRVYLHFLWSNRFSILLSALLLLGAGWFALQNLPESVFPNVNFPRVAVLVNDGSLPVKFMEVEVTKPLEALAKGQPGVRLVRSQTGNGLSKLNIYFEPGTNPQTAYLMLQARLAQYRLPAGAQLRVIRMAPYTYPFAEYALVSNQKSSSAMMPTFAFKIRPALLSIPGVYQVQGTGRGWPQVHVDLDPARLAQHHLSAQQVIDALQSAQGPFFSGVLHAYHQQLILATTARPENDQTLAALTLPLGPPDASGARTPLALGALGQVHTGPPPLLSEAAVPGYQHALIIDVLAQSGANDVTVAQAVQTRLNNLRKHLPPGVHLVPIYDLSHLISHSLRDVWIALGLGSLIAWLVVLAFLGRLDGALATLAVVPLALAATFLVLHMLGYGLNIMTLGGITAAIGALVDHAIVVVERGLHGLQGKASQRRQLALRRSADILPLMTLATLTSCLVFLPLLFLSGTLGLLFRHMALAIVIALLASQLVALLVTPILTAWLAGRVTSPSRRLHQVERWVRRHYSQWLIAGMRRPYWAILPVAILAGAAGLALTVLPTAFLPHWDEGIISVPYRTQVGSSVAETTRIGRAFMQAALHNPNVQRASLMVGRGFEFRHAPANKGAITIVLKPDYHDSTETVMAELRKQYRSMAPNLIGLSLHQTMIVRLGNLSGAHAPLVIYLFGSDSSVLRGEGVRLAAALKNSHDFASVNFKSPSAGPELEITPTPMAALYGITPPGIADQLKARFWGRQAGFLLHGEQILPIRVKLVGQPQTPQTLSALPIQLPDGAMTSLSSIASLHIQGAIPFVTHQNLVPDAYMWLQPKPGEGLAQAARQAKKIITQMHLPGNITPVLGGYYRQQRQSFQQMALILAGALGLLLILLGFQFSSQRAAVAALLSIALAAPGSLLLLWICGLELDSTAFLGVLLVFAIAVNNVILIFARARQIGGTHPRPALVAFSARQRLRPILMTMLADVFGFLPLAIGIGHGTDLLKPLAIAVMGGLLLSIFMSLWLAPVLYSALMTSGQIDSNRKFDQQITQQ
ncbi:efflux RND transporter permease subunit [Acidithiobacillus thiooxidans]|uniref:efflux RND transporter permease subunit n=1 Tax=Acidithiobacillus thiooxidans TaxID=930 RepID=UPI002866319A|nr:efflux RND transporter permease subunit [Acidithiobacillus thiooxidans]MDR7925471.1 efflux RND transporter permease subunit [Acidithiobacillus thiooxidans]